MKEYWASGASSVLLEQPSWELRRAHRCWNCRRCRARLPNHCGQRVCITSPSSFLAERISDESSYVWLQQVWRSGRATTLSAKPSTSLILTATASKYTGIVHVPHGIGSKGEFRWQPTPSIYTP